MLNPGLGKCLLRVKGVKSARRENTMRKLMSSLSKRSSVGCSWLRLLGRHGKSLELCEQLSDLAALFWLLDKNE